MSDPFKQCDEKVKFATEGMARRVGKRWGQRAYRCDVCNRWHLTSRREERRLEMKKE